MKAASPQDDRPITSSDLEELFFSSEKPEPEFRVGGEAEKFGVDVASGAPAPYEGPKGVRRIFEYLTEKHGWVAEGETEGGPPIALTRGMASITLEPGAQFELSGAPHEDIHAVVDEMRAHLDELGPISEELGLAWLGVGFHPFATQADLPWVPKHRYGVMREYLPTQPARGSRGLDMMRRTATVQANFDYASEDDAMQKLVVLLRFSPIVHAMTACAPFVEGRVGERKSERGEVWLHMDPSRSGLVPSVWKKERPRYRDYVEWALDAGMFLFRRGESFVHNTGQTFRDFLANGHAGHRATFADWALHVNTLFPEARLKRTLEVRSADSVPLDLAGAVPALFTGLIYDARALDQATELALSLDYETMETARPAMVTSGLDARIGGSPAVELAERVFTIAKGGLERRARKNAEGKDETVHLARLGALLSHARTPADDLREGLVAGQPVAPAELVRRCLIR